MKRSRQIARGDGGLYSTGVCSASSRFLRRRTELDQLPVCCGGTGNQCTAISLPKETWPRAVCRRMAKSESERTIAFTLKNRDGPADTHCLSGTPLVPSSAGGMWLKARSLDAQFEFLAGSNAQV